MSCFFTCLTDATASSSWPGVLSTAENSGHYIHVDEPEVAVEAIERVASQAAD